MNTSLRTYGYNFNPEALKKLQKINSEIDEENSKEIPDKDKLFQLRQEQLIRGMQLGQNWTNNFRRNIPW